MKPLKYISNLRSDNEYADLPAQAIFEIDEHAATRIAMLARSVLQADAHKIEVFDHRTTWLKQECETTDDLEDPENHERVECDTLIVSRDEFWFAGYLKHSNVRIFTDRQRISDMLAHFGIVPIERVEDRAMDLIGMVARLAIWDWMDEEGSLISEIDPPSEGLCDSHAALMNLIESARAFLKSIGQDGDPPDRRVGPNDLVFEQALASHSGLH